MKWFLCAVASAALIASQSTAQQSTTVDKAPAAIESSQMPADATIEAIKPKSAYAAAHELGEKRGKLCVFVGATWCGPCQPAKALFRKLATEAGDSASCVELDVDRDAATAGEMLAIANQTSIPCVLVFSKRDGEWFVKLPACSESSLRAKMIGTNGQASFAAECIGCKSCPADCAANGCGCSSSNGTSGDN